MANLFLVPDGIEDGHRVQVVEQRVGTEVDRVETRIHAHDLDNHSY